MRNLISAINVSNEDGAKAFMNRLGRPQDLGMTALGLEASKSEGCSNCEKELRECCVHAIKNEETCLKSVTITYLNCAAACTIGCLITGPGYPECLIACEAACAAGAGAALAYCHLLLVAETGVCYIKYYECKKEH